jgi:hypothetical protein
MGLTVQVMACNKCGWPKNEDHVSMFLCTCEGSYAAKGTTMCSFPASSKMVAELKDEECREIKAGREIKACKEIKAWYLDVFTTQCPTCPVAFPTDPDRPYLKQCKDCFKDKSTRRKCRICDEPKIPCTEEAWRTVCGTCFKDSPMRPCVGCKQMKIKTIDEWKQICGDCWEDKEKYLKICKVCKKIPVKRGAESWVETCTKCYLEELKKTFEKCPTCNSVKLVKRKTAPCCRECMKEQGLIQCA